MNTVTSLFKQAQLAEAAYADFFQFPDLRTALEKEGFSPAQTAEFILHWRIVPNTHLPNTGSGFSATVFESLDHPGEFSLAIRGSLDRADFIADTQLIATDGVAISQLVDLYNYWQSLTHTGTYDVKKLTTQSVASTFLNELYLLNGANITAELINLFAGVNIPTTYDTARAYFVEQGYIVEGGNVYMVEPDTSANIYADNRQFGSGVLIGKTVSVDGHSLGGHLAMAFSRLFPSATNNTIAINGLGFKIGDANVNNLFAALGGATGFDASKIENVYGIAGFEFAAMNNSVLQQPGGWDGTYIEDGAGNALGHSTKQMTDSLVVANLFIRLDSSFANQSPAQALTKLNIIFEQSSKTPEKSLEELVISLRQLVLGEQSPEITTNDREALYSSITTLQNSELFKALEGKLTIAEPPTTADGARNNLGAFLSLFYLTPFAFKTDDAEIKNLLYTIHEALANKWNDDRNLTPEQIANSEANFSDMWLSDRAAMLSALIKANSKDKDTISGAKGPDNIDYINVKTNTTIHVVGEVFNLPSTAPASKVMFGNIEGNTLTGGEKADYLYGMGGDDTLSGQSDDDYLEGNEGNDTLNGEAGKDTLLGDNGIDTLDGGEGNDQLKGGAGQDIYNFTGEFGTDIVTDSDGSGTVIVNGKTLSTANFKLENIYKDEISGYTFTKLNNGKSIAITKEGDGNRIIINDWSETESLGLTLTGSAPAAPVPTLAGDFQKKIDDHATADTSDDTYVIINGNYTPDETAPDGEANALDLMNGTAGADVIDGKGGDDYLNGKSGDDYIDGGTGGDYIQGGMGKDTLNGGAGDDFIYGSSDEDIGMPTDINFTKPANDWTHPQATGFNWVAGYNDSDVYSNGTPKGYTRPSPRNRLTDDQGNLIDGGVGNDFIAAGTGADYVHGGADKDVIWGMDKDDILFGDGDFLMSDLPKASNDNNWRQYA